MRLAQRGSNSQRDEPPSSAANAPSDPKYLLVLTICVHRRHPSSPSSLIALNTGCTSPTSAGATDGTPEQDRATAAGYS